jgi:3',5'-nucleoside bisphosphate phosphatase
MSMAIDLHSHSTVSDGSFSPGDLAKVFAASGVTVLALTDHDSVGGRREFLASCEEVGITGIVGIEFSTMLHGNIDTHILGYGIPFDDPRWISFMGHHADYLKSRCEKTLSLLGEYGYEINIEDVYHQSGGNPPMPPHLLKVLMEKGLINDLNEVVQFFVDYLATDAKAWVPHETMPEAPIGILNEIGAVPIISHPIRHPGIGHLEELLDMGAKGFELYYPEQNGDHFERLSEIAKRRDCLVTGGCDFHGAFAERRIKEVDVPFEAAQRLFRAIGMELPKQNLSDKGRAE